jgi:hypothetical protein
MLEERSQRHWKSFINELQKMIQRRIPKHKLVLKRIYSRGAAIAKGVAQR